MSRVPEKRAWDVPGTREREEVEEPPRTESLTAVQFAAGVSQGLWGGEWAVEAGKWGEGHLEPPKRSSFEVLVPMAVVLSDGMRVWSRCRVVSAGCMS